MNIVSKRGWYFLFSALLIVPGLISLISPPGWLSLNSGLNAGIDFTSGSALNITFDSESSIQEEIIRERLDALGHGEALVQKTGSRSVLIRTRLLAEASGTEISERKRIQDDLEKFVAPIRTAEFDSISPIVATETARNALIALMVAAFGIFLFVWYAFHRVPKSYRYGASAILALSHDLLIVLGVFSILGKVIDMEVNSMFIVGLLTVAGYSVNDTIVVFDRIRENVTRHSERPLESLVNLSILETVGRSLNTGITTMLVLLAMLLIGGESIRELLLVLAIGVVVGTYSSIFIASQFLVIWDQGEIGKLLRTGRRTSTGVATALLHLIGR
jgi:preprotein translocase subunit SecF